MKLTSPAFAEAKSIPVKYTCQGADLSVPLVWSELPAGTRSLALIVDDPDAPDPAAPKRTWVHWVLYDIAPGIGELPEGASTELPHGDLPHGEPAHGIREGVNDWQRTGWGGPCPPIGRHRYFHKLYALDTVLGDLGEPTKAALLAAMRGHVLAEAVLMGTYQKTDR